MLASAFGGYPRRLIAAVIDFQIDTGFGVWAFSFGTGVWTFCRRPKGENRIAQGFSPGKISPINSP